MATKHGGRKAQCSKKITKKMPPKSSSSAMCLYTTILKDLFCGLSTFGQFPHMYQVHDLVLLLAETDGAAVFATTSLCHICFGQCLYYQISHLNIPEGMTIHVLLSSQLHNEELHDLHSPNISRWSTKGGLEGWCMQHIWEIIKCILGFGGETRK